MLIISNRSYLYQVIIFGFNFVLQYLASIEIMKSHQAYESDRKKNAKNDENIRKQIHVNNLSKNKKEKIVLLFPKQPYHTQVIISNQLYQILEQKKTNVVIVESPTGTGKTYALLAGVLAWLQDNPHEISKFNGKDEKSQRQQESLLPSWLNNKKNENLLAKLIQIKEEKISKIKTIREVKESQIKRMSSHKNEKKNQNRTISGNKLEWDVEDIQDAVDKEQLKKRNNNIQIQNIFIEKEALPKVIFVSRTHSQLSQVMESIGQIGVKFRYVSMASKDHLCVHIAIQKNKVHQKCQYLMSHGGCPYYHQQGISDLLGLRIQEAQKVGQQSGVCSYFGIKNLLPLADIICVPYSSILNGEIRSRLNISIQNSIVIFDEAHNIIEQELNIKSPEITYKQLAQLCSRVDEYKEKSKLKMNKSNLQLIEHIQDICRALMSVIKQEFERMNKKTDEYSKLQQSYFDEYRRQQAPNYVKMTKIQLFSKLKLSEIKVHKIKNYISLSNFDQKLVHLNSNQLFSLSIINNFLDFISILTSNPAKKTENKIESTVVLLKSLHANQQLKGINLASIKIFCMESTEIAEIVHNSRMTILAGGTMQPISSFTNIFKQNNLSYQFLKGEHVIKDQQCNVYCIGGAQILKQKKGESEKLKLTFTFKQLKNIGKLMQYSCKIIKKITVNTQKNSGIIIFLQNYGLLEVIATHLGTQLDNKKIYYDGMKDLSGKQDKNKNTQKSPFQKYQKSIKEQKKSAILVSVMGGKLSEGINFSDELARSIIVMGLPYPNLKAPEMIEKMKYLDKKLKQKLEQKQDRGEPAFESGNKRFQKLNSELEETGNGYYQNCCIKTINQTIGRGIRHINDYANIYLIDYRFSGIAHRLPTWMQKRINHIDFYQC